MSAGVPGLKFVSVKRLVEDVTMIKFDTGLRHLEDSMPKDIKSEESSSMKPCLIYFCFQLSHVNNNAIFQASAY